MRSFASSERGGGGAAGGDGEQKQGQYGDGGAGGGDGVFQWDAGGKAFAAAAETKAGVRACVCGAILRPPIKFSDLRPHLEPLQGRPFGQCPGFGKVKDCFGVQPENAYARPALHECAKLPPQ